MFGIVSQLSKRYVFVLHRGCTVGQRSEREDNWMQHLNVSSVPYNTEITSADFLMTPVDVINIIGPDSDITVISLVLLRYFHRFRAAPFPMTMNGESILLDSCDYDEAGCCRTE